MHVVAPRQPAAGRRHDSHQRPLVPGEITVDIAAPEARRTRDRTDDQEHEEFEPEEYDE